jgi:hypothetical protein
VREEMTASTFGEFIVRQAGGHFKENAEPLNKRKPQSIIGYASPPKPQCLAHTRDFISVC